MQLDASNMKIIAQLEKAHDGPQAGQPAQQVSLTPVNQRQVRTRCHEDFQQIVLFMAAQCNRAGHYILALWFVSFFFFPRLISAAADWMSTILPHMVWPQCEFRMQV